MASQLDQLDDGGSTIDLGSAVRILRKRLWLVLSLVVAIPLSVGVYVSKQPKIYEATASLDIKSSAPQYLGQSFKDAVEISGDWWSTQEMLQTELQVLHSHSLAVAVVEALCAQKVKQNGADMNAMAAAYGPDAGKCDKPAIDRYAPAIQGVRVDPVKDSRIVLLSMQHSNPEMAALVTNTFAEVYKQRNLDKRQTQSTGAAIWLGDQYNELATKLNNAERALIDFKRKNNVVSLDLENQQNELSSSRRKLADELGTITVKLIALRAQRSQYATLKTSDPLTDVSPGIADNPVMVKLKELYIDQYGKLLEMKGKYLEKHPTVIAQQARVDAIREDMKREAALAGKNVEAQYDTLAKQEHDLKTALDSKTREALVLEDHAREYNKLKRDFDSLVKSSEQVGGREREQALAGNLKTNNVSIVDEALVPTAAIAPNVNRAVGLAFVVALVLGIGLAFALELLDSTVKTQEDVERAVGAAFLGLIPSIVEEAPGKNGQPGAGQGAMIAPPAALADVIKAGSKDLYVLTHPKSSVAECCRSIRTNLLFMTPDKPAKTLLVTSAGPQEGKSTTAINLAITLAQSGLRVLLVDTDMRRPRLHRAFGIPSNTDGLSRAIVGETDVLKSVRETGVPNLSLLPCGACPPNPAELLHAERFKKIVATVAEAYDRVIFDSPPIGLVTDAAILARSVDGTIVVAKGATTSKDALIRARRQLQGEGVNILGAILNDLDLNKPGGYGYNYYYYSKYGYYYGDDANAKASGART